MKDRGGRKYLGMSASLILINLAAILERADENLLPAVYKEVSETFKVGPSDLGYLTFTLKFVQGIASPLAGVLVIQYDRPTVLAMGTVFWALSTGAVGLAHRFSHVAFWRALNGVGLAIVIPALQSFVADSYSDTGRGTGFGMLSLVGNLGGIGGGVLATLMAAHTYFGIPGWRFAFLLMSAISILIACLVYLFVVDPRRAAQQETSAASDRKALIERANRGISGIIWQESWTAIKAVAKVQTFQVIVSQGLVGSLPWTAMVFFTMWFELIGFDHKSSAALLSIFALGSAMGSLLGGVIADRASRAYPYSGRIMCAQVSAFLGIPFSWFLLSAIQQNVDNWINYAATLLLMGLLISWNGSAVNAPIFAEVVPTKHRTMIYAFDRTLEGSFSSFAAPLVGILSEAIYGYHPGSTVNQALALSRGILSMMVVPFALCCLLYTPLYFIFKRDREIARVASFKDEDHCIVSS